MSTDLQGAISAPCSTFKPGNDRQPLSLVSCTIGEMIHYTCDGLGHDERYYSNTVVI